MKSQDRIVIDPIAMNIVNRIAPGTSSSGVLECSGGILVQGRFEGKLIVKGGPLVLLQEAVVSGEISCENDAYLFGTVTAREDGSLSEINVGGAAFMTETLQANANITTCDLRMYEGAQVEGRIRTVKRAKR